MTAGADTEPQPTEAERRAEKERYRLSSRAQVPEDLAAEYDKLTQRVHARHATAIIRDRIRRTKAEAAVPVAEVIVAGLRRF